MDVCDEVVEKAGLVYTYQGPGEFDKERFKKEKKDVLQNYVEVVVPDLLSKLQTLYEMNKSTDGYFVRDELTIADLLYFAAFDFAECFMKDSFTGFPKMAALFKKIIAHKKVAEWLKKTDYGNNPMDLLKEKL
ncbi:uncharacterized protein [Amphiura filiformis]|uniref:uncharacterized protein n=1 Tax=Amphiura filiformis TaxID=82378 RepID=UPI003B2202DD